MCMAGGVWYSGDRYGRALFMPYFTFDSTHMLQIKMYKKQVSQEHTQNHIEKYIFDTSCQKRNSYQLLRTHLQNSV